MDSTGIHSIQHARRSGVRHWNSHKPLAMNVVSVPWLWGLTNLCHGIDAHPKLWQTQWLESALMKKCDVLKHSGTGLWEQYYVLLYFRTLFIFTYLRLPDSHWPECHWMLILQDSIAVIHRVGTSTQYTVHHCCVKSANLCWPSTAGCNPTGFFNLGRWAVLICIAEVLP